MADSQSINPTSIIPWGSLFESLLLIVIIAFLIERVLSIIFETAGFLKMHSKLKERGFKSSKTLIALGISVAVAQIYQLDIFARVNGLSESSFFGIVLTGFVLAGGSKASLKLFRDVLGIYSNEYQLYKNEVVPPNHQPKSIDRRNCIR